MRLANEARQAKYEVKTNADGRFEFVGLPAGEYAVEAQGIGFQPLKDAVTVAGQNLQRNYVLKIGTLQETINTDFDSSDASNDAKDTPAGEKDVRAEADRVCCIAGRRPHHATEENSRCPPVLSVVAARRLDGRDGQDARPASGSMGMSPTSASLATRIQTSHRRQSRPCGSGDTPRRCSTAPPWKSP